MFHMETKNVLKISLGSSSSFEVAPDQPKVTGMQYAGTLIPVEGPSRPPLKIGRPSPEEAAEMQRPRPAPPSLSIPELLADTERALVNYEKHHQKRDCSELEKQLRSELFASLLGFYVQAEIGRAAALLRTSMTRAGAQKPTCGTVLIGQDGCRSPQLLRPAGSG